MKLRYLSHLIPLAAALLLLAGCGAPPKIRESRVLAADVAKLTSVSLYYRNVEMKTVSSRTYGGGASIANTGFSTFGDALVGQADAVFGKRKVSVLATHVVQGNDPVRFSSDSNGAGNNASPALVITPTRGEVSSTGHATAASYVFSAQLFDPATRRLVWTATIDTRAWIGQDFITKSFDKVSFDASYAAQLLNAVADQMAQDGMI